MTDHTDLIARLESASEGSRELDAAIFSALGLAGWVRGGEIVDDIPAFTSEPFNLTAAISLVPEGFPWWVRMRNVEGEAEFSATINYAETCYAATVALALTACALRARSKTPS